jgi:antibiotic biosynthesis monooxygenase (ABM) superfamily enzyme
VQWVKEQDMAIQVVIKRKVKQGLQAKELVPLILQMRALAMCQPGYIFGETLCDIEHPGECLVISRWETVEDWNKWVQSQERAMVDGKIEALTGDKTEYRIYSSMVPPTIAERENRKRTECVVNC